MSGKVSESFHPLFMFLTHWVHRARKREWPAITAASMYGEISSVDGPPGDVRNILNIRHEKPATNVWGSFERSLLSYGLRVRASNVPIGTRYSTEIQCVGYRSSGLTLSHKRIKLHDLISAASLLTNGEQILADILDELLKPKEDERGRFFTPQFVSAVRHGDMRKLLQGS